MYDRVSGVSRQVPIKAVAQRPKYFDTATETALNDRVERPAQRALANLSNRVELSAQERVRVALYIATMLMRVPKRRAKARELIPGVLKQTIDEVRSALLEIR